MVRDQQTIVIGGLMRDAIQNSEDKVPVLGDIPILGALFRRSNKSKRKTNLLLILTPYIIRDPGDLREIFERKMQERQQMIDRYFVFGDDDFEPYIDYSRTRGLVSEIVNEIDEVEEELRLAEEARLKPPPEHVPRNPIGLFMAEPKETAFVIGPDGEEPMPMEPIVTTTAPAAAPAQAPVEPQPATPATAKEPNIVVPPTTSDLEEGGDAPVPPINAPESPPEAVSYTHLTLPTKRIV